MYVCMRRRERERERKLIIFRNNGRDVMIHNVEKLIRIETFSWPTAISHRRIKKKENMINKRKSKKISQNLIKCYIDRYEYVTKGERKREKGSDMNTEDLSFCAPFKTDTGYAEGSRALMFFRIFVCYISM